MTCPRRSWSSTTAAGRTAYLESAQAAGLHLLAADERNPALTSTWGVGQLLEAALAEGADRIVVGLGGSATNDAGAGLLAALGAGAPHDLARGGLALADVSDAALPGLAAARERFRDVELVLATDVESPLLGLQGASAVFSPQKGASPEVAQALEGALGALRRGRAPHRARADRPAHRGGPTARQDAGRGGRRRARLRPAAARRHAGQRGG